MQKLIVYNWLALAVVSLLVGLYIGIFESFFKDKGYLYIILTLVFGVLFVIKKKGLKGQSRSRKLEVEND